MAKLASSMFQLRTAFFVVAVPLSLSLTGGTAWSETGPEEVGELECSLCLEADGQHRFFGTVWCGPEQNNEDCAACGGTSECHDEWDDGPCHVGCEDHPDLEDQQALIQAVEMGEVRSIVAVMEKAGDAVSLNVERSALQAKGCRDNIALHLPVSSDVLERLVAITVD